MANEVRLEVYTFKVRKRGDKDNYEILDNFFGKGDFYTFLKDYFDKHDKSLLINEELKRSIQVIAEKLTLNKTKRTISGIIESGDYGFESRIVDSRGRPKYNKQVFDLDVKPFYFLMYIPLQSDQGFLLLQRTGIYGINNIFKANLEQFFKIQHPDNKIEFSQFLSKELAQRFLTDGGIKEFIFKRKDLPTDIADKFGVNKTEGEILRVELKIVAKDTFRINRKVKNFINNPNAKFIDLSEVEGIGMDGSQTSSVKVKMSGKTRTIDLSETGKIRPYYDIDSEVTKDKSGHPIFSSIDRIAKEIVAEII